MYWLAFDTGRVEENRFLAACSYECLSLSFYTDSLFHCRASSSSPSPRAHSFSVTMVPSACCHSPIESLKDSVKHRSSSGELSIRRDKKIPVRGANEGPDHRFSERGSEHARGEGEATGEHAPILNTRYSGGIPSARCVISSCQVEEAVVKRLFTANSTSHSRRSSRQTNVVLA